MAKINLNRPQVIEICNFPKHKGKPWTQVAEEDPEYVDWILSYEGPRVTDEQYDYILDVAENTERRGL